MKMAVLTKASSKMILRMVRGFENGQMVKNMTVIGKKGNITGMVNSPIRKDRQERVYGRRENVRNG